MVKNFLRVRRRLFIPAFEKRLDQIGQAVYDIQISRLRIPIRFAIAKKQLLSSYGHAEGSQLRKRSSPAPH